MQAQVQQAQRTTHTPDGNYVFELGEYGLLGSGAHGVVRAARHVESGEFVAVKVMPASVLASVAKELIAQAKMHHPNIVELYTTQVDLDKKRGTFTRIPKLEDVPYPVHMEPNLVVEFYSR